MILMLAPGPNLTFGPMPSGANYVSDQYALIKVASNSTTDQTALAQAGCYTLTPFGGWGTFGFTALADLYAADAASGLIGPNQVGFPRFVMADVFADNANTGSWQKTGAGNGAGNWTQRSNFTSVTAATAAQAAATAVGGSIILENVDGLAACGVDANGFILWQVDNAGVFSSISTPTVTAQDVPGYAMAWVDANGFILAGLTTAGAWVTASGQAAASAAADRPLTVPDGVTRLAAWTILPVYGESTAVGAEGMPALSLTQPYANLTFGGGPKAQPGTAGVTSSKPLVEDNVDAVGAVAGHSGETLCSSIANAVSAYVAGTYGVAPASMPIFSFTAGKGGQTLGLAGTSLVKGDSSGNYARLVALVTAAKALADAAGATCIIPAVVLIVGANDANASVGTTGAAYKAALKQLASDLDADLRAITGQAPPVATLIYQTSATFTGGALEPIQLAQLQAAAEQPLIRLTSPWYDIAFAADGVHGTDSGYRTAGRRIGVHAARYLFEGRTRALQATAATARGQTIRVRFSEDVTIDQAALGAATNAGVLVSDASGAVPLASAAVDAGDLVLTATRALAATPVVRVALDYRCAGASGNAGTSHSSNVRAVLTHPGSGGTTIYRWAPHQQLPILALEA